MTAGAGERVRKTVLSNGIRVVTEYIPGVRSASVGLWVGIGSRDEKPSVAGAAHFLEHLLFKATPTRDAASIAEQMDAIGGELNAFTSKEHTCFYAHVLDDHLEQAVDVVCDVVLRGRCRRADVDLERDVVLEEIAMRDDDPEDLLADEFMTAMFGDQPIGRPVIGSAESISAMTREQLHSFHTRRYTPDRMVLAVAGNVDHAAVVAQARRSTGSGRGVVTTPSRPVVARRPAGGVTTEANLRLTHRETEQAHLLLGMPTPGRGSPDRWALSLLNVAVGGGLSSRLYQEIREERGLAYSVYSTVDTFSDVGTFSVYAGCSPDSLGEVVGIIRRILEQVAVDGITDAEVDRAKGALRGGMVLGLEDSQSRMHRLGGNELADRRRRSLADTLDRIDRVTPAQLRRVAARVLDQPAATAVVGPFRSVRRLPAEVRRR
nr:pitrilysin family protein [Williamsia sterculiae]